ncbi:hypothetical protein FHX82_000562 [Amycolatopsis bartoniae]|nr:hypothetical protein [Amycolatopsis bartoniae]
MSPRSPLDKSRLTLVSGQKHRSRDSPPNQKIRYVTALRRCGATGSVRWLRAGASLTQIRGLPGRGRLLGLSDICGRPRCLLSVQVWGSMSMPDRSPPRRSTV